MKITYTTSDGNKVTVEAVGVHIEMTAEETRSEFNGLFREEEGRDSFTFYAGGSDLELKEVEPDPKYPNTWPSEEVEEHIS